MVVMAVPAQPVQAGKPVSRSPSETFRTSCEGSRPRGRRNRKDGAALVHARIDTPGIGSCSSAYVRRKGISILERVDVSETQPRRVGERTAGTDAGHDAPRGAASDRPGVGLVTRVTRYSLTVRRDFCASGRVARPRQPRQARVPIAPATPVRASPPTELTDWIPSRRASLCCCRTPARRTAN